MFAVPYFDQRQVLACRFLCCDGFSRGVENLFVKVHDLATYFRSKVHDLATYFRSNEHPENKLAGLVSNRAERWAAGLELLRQLIAACWFSHLVTSVLHDRRA